MRQEAGLFIEKQDSTAITEFCAIFNGISLAVSLRQLDKRIHTTWRNNYLVSAAAHYQALKGDTPCCVLLPANSSSPPPSPSSQPREPGLSPRSPAQTPNHNRLLERTLNPKASFIQF